MFAKVKNKLRNALAAFRSSKNAAGKNSGIPDFRPAPAAPGVGQLRPAQGGVKPDVLHLPLRIILPQLPPALRERMRPAAADDDIAISYAVVLPQLARGVVKVQFGELRRSAPQLFFPEGDLDQTWIILPLAEVVARLDPKLVQCQRAHRRLQIPTDMPSPFDLGGNAPTSPAPTAPQTTAAGESTPATAPDSVALPPPAQIPAPASPDFPSLRPDEKFSAPIALKPDLAPAVPVPAPAPEPVATAPIPFTFPPAVAAPSPEPPPTPLPMPAPVVIPATPAQASRPPAVPVDNVPTAVVTPDGASLQIRLSAIAEKWPDAVRTEISQLGLAGATLILPLESAQQGLKRGQLSYSWKTIRGWLTPPVPTGDSAYDSAHLVVPLKAVAPAFLAAHRHPSKKQKVVLDESIPDLFQLTPPEASVDTKFVAAAKATNPAGPSPIEAVPTLPPTPSRPATEPETPAVDSEKLTPHQIVFQATALAGVAGAVVTLRDGLPVAERLPAAASTEAIAGFVPQLYNLVGKNVREFKLGELTRLRFDIGRVPWEIFQTGDIFFAAYGHADQPLPEQKLAALALKLENNS